MKRIIIIFILLLMFFPATGGTTPDAAVQYVTVLAPPSVTTYDFAIGAGVDKWAFRYQINPLKPPTTNDTPDVEFVGTPPDRKGEYTRISKDDHKMQKDSSGSFGNYTAHRFVFNINISESADSIGDREIDVQWIGKGVTRNRTQEHGATLYIWNNTNTGYYEELGNTTSRRRETLSENITANTGNYIDTAGNLMILVVQNANQSARRGRPLVSKLSTDYVKIDIIPLPPSSKSASIAASTSEETGNSWLDRVQQGGVALFRWLLGG